MSNIEVNPDELRIFEVSLRDLRGEVQAQRIALERETHDVQKFWDDEKYKKFLRKQEELLFQVQMFEKICDHYGAYLLRKAAAADAYLNR